MTAAGPEPKPPPKGPLAGFFAEVSAQLAPEYQSLAELMINFREKPHASDLARALFRAEKIAAVLREAHRQLIARGTIGGEVKP